MGRPHNIAIGTPKWTLQEHRTATILLDTSQHFVGVTDNKIIMRYNTFRTLETLDSGEPPSKHEGRDGRFKVFNIEE